MLVIIKSMFLFKYGDYFYHVTLKYRILSVDSDVGEKHTITGIYNSINEQIKVILMQIM